MENCIGQWIYGSMKKDYTKKWSKFREIQYAIRSYLCLNIKKWEAQKKIIPLTNQWKFGSLNAFQESQTNWQTDRNRFK